MILHEALVGGTIYLDYIESEMELPESERVAFDYGAIKNRDRINLLHRSANASGMPNGADVCAAAIDGLGKKIRNLKASDGSELDTVAKLLAYADKDLAITYMLEIVGSHIWRRQAGGEVDLKNSK